MRSLAKPVPVELEGPFGEGATATIRFMQPEYGVAPGQAAVLYAGERVVGGGWHDAANLSQDPENTHVSICALLDLAERLVPHDTLLAERAQEAIRVAQEGNTPLALIFLDLDHFKHVNDSLGHRVGDTLLVEIAKRLRAVVLE